MAFRGRAEAGAPARVPQPRRVAARVSGNGRVPVANSRAPAGADSDKLHRPVAVGRAVVAPPARPIDEAQPAGAWPTARDHTRAGTALARGLVVAAELAVVGFVLARLTVTALSAPVRPAEAYAVARVVAVTQPDVRVGTEAWPRQVFDVLLSGILSAAGAVVRSASAIAVLRVVELVTATAVVGLAWLLAKRMQFGPAGRSVAVLAIGAAPSAVALLSGSVRPGVFAAAFGALALALVTGGYPSRLRKLTALVAAAAMLLVLPATLAALLAAIAVGFAHDELARGLSTRWRTVFAVIFECLATAALVGLAKIPTAGPAAQLPEPARWEWVLVALLGGFAVVGLARRWLRAPAVAGLVLVLTAAVSPAEARADLVVVALPVLAVVAVGALEEVAGRLSARVSRLGARLSRRERRRQRPVWAYQSERMAQLHRATGRRMVIRAAVSLVVALAAAVAVVGVVAAAPPRVRPAAGPAAATWLSDEVPGDPAVIVDDLLWPQLLRAGVQVSRIGTPSGIGTRGPTDWRMVAGPDASAGSGWRRYAAFGSGAGQVTVFGRSEVGERQVQPAALERRKELGSALAGNPRIRFTRDAAAALRRGAVDPRLIFVLADVAGQHDLGVAAFPAVPGETTDVPPLRRVLVTTVDGRPATDPAGTALLRTWLDSQLEPYRPRAVEQTGGGLLIRYALTNIDV